MMVSMTHPHDPYAIPAPYWDRYRDEEIDMPRVPAAPADDDPHSRRLRHVSDMDSTPVTPQQVRAARRAYYGAISYVDEQIGVLLRALEEAGSLTTPSSSSPPTMATCWASAASGTR